MGERYLVTGVQLGMLIGLSEAKDRRALVDSIIDLQYIDEHSKNIMQSCVEINKLLRKK